MRVEPASIDQIRRGSHGRMVAIDKDAGNVAEDLRRIDPCFKVRFAENGAPPFWAVYWESEDGRDAYLVSTFQARQSNSGVWTGLDQRVVSYIQSIDPRTGYDYPRELEAARVRGRDATRGEFREKVREAGERAAHAVRRDLGVKDRAFIR